jgi:radial spoke head protein 4/6
VLLEDVSPEQIQAARVVSKFMTGDLDASVRSYPPFPGKEKHFLRAQIARIAHATILCPKGAFVAPEEDESGIAEPERNEDYKSMQVAAMRDPANWCHRCEGLQS